MWRMSLSKAVESVEKPRPVSGKGTQPITEFAFVETPPKPSPLWSLSGICYVLVPKADRGKRSFSRRGEERDEYLVLNLF